MERPLLIGCGVAAAFVMASGIYYAVNSYGTPLGELAVADGTFSNGRVTVYRNVKQWKADDYTLEVKDSKGDVRSRITASKLEEDLCLISGDSVVTVSREGVLYFDKSRQSCDKPKAEDSNSK